MTVSLTVSETGILLPVHAQPGARQNAIVGVHDGRLKVAVTAVPEKGKANAAILKLLAKELGFKSSQLEVTAGATSKQKTVLITGCVPQTLRTRLAEY